MRAYICFDDTDNVGAPRGTGKLARWFEEELPESCSLWAVVRQQLLVDPAVPYTSHNSSACVVADVSGPEVREALIERAAAHVVRHALEDSDPGVCVALEGDPALQVLMAFGMRAATTLASQREAMEAALGVHLSGHGGTNDGIIGAAAGVGLTAGGWNGRFIEYGPLDRRLRDLPAALTAAELQAARILLAPLNKDGHLPRPDDVIDTQGWLRPRLWGGHAVLPIVEDGPGSWRGAVDRRPAEA